VRCAIWGGQGRYARRVPGVEASWEECPWVGQDQIGAV
jgi:hypothetical protein